VVEAVLPVVVAVVGMELQVQTFVLVAAVVVLVDELVVVVVVVVD